jgi:hypothetical protein
VQGTDSGFVVAWHTGGERDWGNAIQAASLDDRGQLFAAGPVTSGDTAAKEQTLVSFGDRFLVVWSAISSDAGRLQLWYELVESRTLEVAWARTLLTKGVFDPTYDVINPRAVRGPNGDVGVAFEENPSFRSYFMRLGCGARDSER